LSCRQGIFRVAKKQLEELALGKVVSISPTAYGTADGMMTRECSGGGDPAGWRARDGKFWFATIRGVALIDPDRIKFNEHPPPVVIEEVRIDDQSIPPGAKIELPP